MLKTFAYYGGPHLLDLALTGFANVPPPARAANALHWSENAFNTQILRQGFWQLPNSKPIKSNILPLLQLVQKIVQQDAQPHNRRFALGKKSGATSRCSAKFSTSRWRQTSEHDCPLCLRVNSRRRGSANSDLPSKCN